MQSHLEILSFDSQILKGNPLKDPTEREVWVYVPSEVTNTAILLLNGFGGNGAALFNRDPMQEDLKTKMDRLIHTKKCLPCYVVTIDCFTKVGGSQYLNSTATGRYEDYCVQEIIPFLEKKYSIKKWGVMGKSSGGYGAIVFGMKYPEIFQAVAMHSGDCNFELCYLPDFGKALSAFKKAGGVERWLDKLWKDENHKRKEYFLPLNILGMSACYSPNPKMPLGVDFPFCLETGIFKPDVWKKWQEKDPVNMVKTFEMNLKKLKAIYIDCGKHDEFSLHWGARALVQAMKERGLTPFFEEFEDGHMSISYRYDNSIPYLLSALK